MSQYINCPNSKCGRPNRSNAKFCKYCGGPISIVGAYVQWQPLVQSQSLHGGEYRVTQSLGKGGMGAVYLVAQIMAGAERRLVLKEMIDYWDPADPQGPARARSRFQDEAAALVLLNLRGVPKIFDYFSESIAGQGRNFIVMEYVEGENLETRVTHTNDALQTVPRKPCSTNEVVNWGIQLCRVLEYLAALRDGAGNPKPIVHHDIKPANVILERNSGDVFLVDFGTAKADLVHQVGGAMGKAKSSVYGTAGYAPPEQYDRGPNMPPHTEPRSDVYALAATLYHLLTDDDPRKHPFDFPRVNTLPTALQAILTRALDQNVNNRPHAVELRKQLEMLAAPRAPQHQAIPFNSTEAFSDLQSLVELCDTNWEDAKTRLFEERDVEVWLGQLSENALAAEAKRISKKYEEDPDRGLELFLEEVEKQGCVRPSRPKAQVQPAGIVDLGELHEDDKRSITIENVGKGFLWGKLKSAPAWLKLSRSEFVGNDPHPIEVKTNLSKLPLGQVQQGLVSFETNGGQLGVRFRVTRTNAPFYLKRAVNLHQAGQTERALQSYQEALRRDPKEAERAEAVAAIAILYFQVGRLNESYLWMRDHKPSRDWMDPQKLRLPNARDVIAQFCWGWANQLFPQIPQISVEEINAWYTHARNLCPSMVAPAVWAQTQILLALALGHQHKFDQAYTLWQGVAHWASQAASTPMLAQQFLGAAQTLRQKRDFSAAAQRYLQARSIYAPVAPAEGLAAIYFEWAQEAYRQNAVSEALRLGTQARALAPNNRIIADTLALWGEYAVTSRRVRAVGSVFLCGAALCALVMFVSACLLQVSRYFPWFSIMSLSAAALSGLGILVFALGYVARREVMRLLDSAEGGLPFLAGLILSNLLWVLVTVLLGMLVNILTVRLPFFASGAQPVWQAGWLASVVCVCFASIAAQHAGDRKKAAIRLFWSAAGGLALGIALGTGAGMLTNLSLLYPRAFDLGTSPVISFWNWIGTGGQAVMVVLLSIVFLGIANNDSRDGCSTVAGLFALLVVILALIAAILLPILAAIWAGMVPEAGWGGALLGLCFALGLLLRKEFRDQGVDATPHWAALCIVVALASLTAWVLSSIYGGVGGLAIGGAFGCLVLGAGGFVESYISGQGKSATYWEPLLTLERIAVLAVLAFLAALMAGLWLFAPTRNAIIGEAASTIPRATSTLLPASTSTGTPMPATEIAVALTPVAGMVQRRGTDNAEMVFVSAGEYAMGSTSGDGDENPPHTVYVDAVWIDKYEVTNALYGKCVDAGKCPPPSSRSSATRSAYYGNPSFDNYPVLYVSWDDAVAYCAWVGKRLPTEAEWEKAARGTDGRTYPWGNTFDKTMLNSTEGGKGDTAAAGSYPTGASPYGALDMAGNVWEWVGDWHDSNYYAKSPRSNPLGASSGQYRSVRGGAWDLGQFYVRTSYRYNRTPTYRGANIGFRCVQ